MAYIAIRCWRVLDASEIVHPQVGRCASAAAAARAKPFGRVDGEEEGGGDAGGSGRNLRDGRDFAAWVMTTLADRLSSKSGEQFRVHISSNRGRQLGRRRGW